MDAADGDQRAGFRRRRFGKVRKFFGVGLQVLEKTFELALHRVHLFAHVQNDLDPGEVHAEIARQRQNNFQTLEIGVGVKTRVAFRLFISDSEIKPLRRRGTERQERLAAD